MSKCINTVDLILANRRSVQRRCTNTLTSAELNRLDNDGIHVVGTHMMIGDGEAVRCHMYIKLKDSDAPWRHWFDMPVDVFNRLQDIQPSPTP